MFLLQNKVRDCIYCSILCDLTILVTERIELS